MSGTLFLCATPIGNLRDITFRAIDVLNSVDLIAAEDTRHTLKLLNHYNIKTPMTSYHQHNEKSKAKELINHLKAGKSLAVVSDAGLPGISDPGEVLVRFALEEDIPVDVIPGPTAFASGLVISGLSTSSLFFAGFLPSGEQARRRALNQSKEIPGTHIYYEAPHRLERFLKDALSIYGDVDAVIARELTKLHQEILRGRISELLAKLQQTPPRGEIAVYLSPPRKPALQAPEQWLPELSKLLNQGMDKKEAIKNLAETYKVPKREIYNQIVKAVEQE